MAGVPRRRRQLAIAARPAEVDLGFWRAVLGYAGGAEDNAVDCLGHGSTVWMQQLDDTKPLRHAMDINVSVASEQAQARLEAALAEGGRIVDDSQAPPSGSWLTLPATVSASSSGPTGPPPQIRPRHPPRG